ncbi:MAG: GxxExxY protein [Bacteroidales bacterium]|nr:GxxExxY protein [Bacteroidales bacterium]MCB9012701.1 GxxExxY protein [Bacteroidales bacterium]
MEKIENSLSRVIVSACFKIHKNPGPGLLESVYEEILCYELEKQNLQFIRQKPVPLIYENIKLELGFRADIIVENKIIIEVKAIELLAPVHKMQLLTYLKITDIKLGLLVNFNCYDLSGNIKRLVNNL